jgi:hypothetical protein
MKIKLMKDFLVEAFSPVEREKLIHSLMEGLEGEVNRDIVMEELEWFVAEKLVEVKERADELIHEAERGTDE